MNNSVNIDIVCGLLSVNFTQTRTNWIHLVASLFTNMQNSVCISLRHDPMESFRDLTPSEQSSLDSINLATESFRELFTKYQSQPNDWSLSYRCMSECHLPCSLSDWEAHVMTCRHILQAAHNTIVNEGIRRTHDKLEAWFAGEQDRKSVV